MEELITKPLNRLWSNSKKYAKHQIGEFYGYTKEDGTKMNDGPQPKVKYINNNKHSFKLDRSNECNNIIINESFINNVCNDSCNVTNQLHIDRIIPNDSNKTIELVTVKMIEAPIKNLASFVHFNNSINKKEIEDETEFNSNLSNLDSSLFDVNINSTPKKYLHENKEDCEDACVVIESENKQTDIGENKDQKSIVKVKIIVPKGSMDKMKKINGVFSQSNKLVFESREQPDFFIENTCTLTKLNSPIDEEIAVDQDNVETITMNNNIVLETDKPIVSDDQTDSSNNCEHSEVNSIGRNMCIFEENRSRPLSPIFAENMNALSNTENNVEHSQQNVLATKPTFRHSVPIMGKAALLAKVQRPIDKATLNDSEIISDLVRERFIVNAFKSNTLQRSNNRFARNDKLYRSLDVKMYNGTTNKHKYEHTKLIHINQSSPSKLEEPSVSLAAAAERATAAKTNVYQTFNSHVEAAAQDTTIHQPTSYTNTCIENKNNYNVTEDHKEECSEEKKTSTKIHSKTIDGIFNDEKTLEYKKLSKSEPNLFCNVQTEIVVSSIVDFRKVEKAEMAVYSVCNSQSTFPITDPSSRCSLATDDLPSMEELPSLDPLSSLDNVPIYEDLFTETKNFFTENESITENINKINKNVSFEDEPANDETTIPNEYSSYDMDAFLKKALGDEFLDQTTTTINTISQEQAQQANDKKKFIPEDSICTSDASDLISKSPLTINSSFYQSFTKKLRRISNNLRNTPTISEHPSENDLNSVLPNNDLVNELVRRAAAQYEAMKQISKALTLCRNTKEFAGSIEQIEGERLLLIAIHRRQALLSEIRRIDYDLDDNTYPSIETGKITINNINFPLKDNVENQTFYKDYNQWFVCMLSHGSRLLATQLVLAKEKGPIIFPEEFTFVDLPTDFTINIDVFSLLQRNNIRNYSHDSKFHLNKASKSTHCPSPKNLLHRDKHVHKMLSRCDTGVLVSSFKAVGSLKIKVADIGKAGPWQLRKVPLSSNLYGIINMNIKSQVKIPIKQIGFLTVGRKINNIISWNRLWCKLTGHLIYFWNYPCDEDAVEPLNMIDLKKCVNARIEPADRSICPRPRTLLLETNTPQGSNHVDTYFFQTDTLLELDIWSAQLNKIVSATRTWNDSYFSH